VSVDVVSVGELVEGRIMMRISRFTVVVEIGGEKVSAYLNNSGRLLQLLKPGSIGYLVKVNKGLYRKLSYRLVGVRDKSYAAIVDTKIQEEVFAILVDRDVLPWLQSFRIAKKYPRIGRKILDYLLTNWNRYILVEIKGALLRLSDDVAGYPDAPTPRGKQHLKLLADLATTYGYEPLVVFICALPSVKKFQLYCNEDKELGTVARYAQEKGVRFKAISIYLDQYRGRIVLENPDIPVNLSCYKHRQI
jgi:sugar fermentation stimulation protein A